MLYVLQFWNTFLACKWSWGAGVVAWLRMVTSEPHIALVPVHAELVWEEECLLPVLAINWIISTVSADTSHHLCLSIQFWSHSAQPGRSTTNKDHNCYHSSLSNRSLSPDQISQWPILPSAPGVQWMAFFIDCTALLLLLPPTSRYQSKLRCILYSKGQDEEEIKK